MKDVGFRDYLVTVRNILSRHYPAFYHLVDKDSSVGFELWRDAGTAWEQGISPSLFAFNWCGDEAPPPKTGVYAERDARSELWEGAYL